MDYLPVPVIPCQFLSPVPIEFQILVKLASKNVESIPLSRSEIPDGRSGSGHPECPLFAIPVI